jgi:hypothetical protein
MFKQGKSFMDPFYMGRGQINQYKTAGMDTSRLRTIRYPAGPDNPDGKCALTGNASIGMIPASHPDPKGIAIFMNVFFQTYNSPNLLIDPDMALVDDINYMFGDDQGLVDYWVKMRRMVDPGILNYGAWGIPFTQVGTLIQSQLLLNLINPGVSIKNYIETVRPGIQAEINTIAQQ